MRDDDSSRRDEDLSELAVLSGWEAAPPPAGLADAVLARLAAPGGAEGADEAGAASTATDDAAPRATAVEPAASHGRRRVWFAALALGGVAAAAVIALRVGRGGPAIAEHGVVAAANPSHLEIGGASADLDAGARVRWTRDQGGVTVWQRGVVRWTVREGSTLRIFPGDAPGVAASSADASHGASIDASGASLRVEIPMTFSDVRVIGASALTAAAVALATVVVYDGHVKATSGGQSVVVMPGATIALREGAPPAPPAPPAPEPPLVGAAAPRVVDRSVTPPVGSDTADDDRPPVQITADTSVLAERDLHSAVQFVAHAGDTLYPSTAVGTWTFVENDEGDAGWVPTSALADGASSSCDPDPFVTMGKQHYETGDYVGAMASLDQALRCHYDASTNRIAFIAACNARDARKARSYFRRLSALDQGSSLIQSCIMHGITPEQLSDAATPLDHAPAAAQSAKAHLTIRCKPAARVLVDGKDTKLTTPIADFAIEPGHHKVTFMIGQDRFTYGVTLKPGERVTLAKDLE